MLLFTMAQISVESWSHDTVIAGHMVNLGHVVTTDQTTSADEDREIRMTAPEKATKKTLC